MNATRTESLWTRRKILIRVALGSAAGLILAACGGGGGGDNSSGDAQALVDAFAKLENGMNAADVEALVGFKANVLRTDFELTWVVDGYRLYVGFYSTGAMTITDASLTPPRGVSQSRDFD